MSVSKIIFTGEEDELSAHRLMAPTPISKTEIAEIHMFISISLYSFNTQGKIAHAGHRGEYVLSHVGPGQATAPAEHCQSPRTSASHSFAARVSSFVRSGS